MPKSGRKCQSHEELQQVGFRLKFHPNTWLSPPCGFKATGIQMQILKRHFSSLHVSKGCLKQEYTPYTCLIFLKQGLQATTDL